MPTRVELHPLALDEVLAQTDWYLGHSVSAARRFELAVGAALDLLSSHPLLGSSHSPRGVRRFKLQRFPHTIFYVPYDDRVLILAVAHNSRQHEYWLARIDKR